MKPGNLLRTFILATVLTATSAAPAATVLIDFSDGATQSNPDTTNGNYWNTIGDDATSGTAADTTVNNLLLSDNSGNSTWDIFVGHYGSAPGVRSGYGGTGISGPVGTAAPFNMPSTDLTRATVDGIFSQSPTQVVTISFSGLAFSTEYALSFVGGRGDTSNTATLELTAGSAVSGLNGSNQATLVGNGSITTFNATSTAGGVITFTYLDPSNVTTSDSLVTLNAMSISNIPEPSTALLGGLGLLALLRRRRA